MQEGTSAYSITAMESNSAAAMPSSEHLRVITVVIDTGWDWVVGYSMHSAKRQLFRLLSWTAVLTYFSLTVWMHIWTLESGIPRPGEPTKPHHQVCTWIGTSGEAGLVDCRPIARPLPVVSSYPVILPQRPVLPTIPWTLEARGPPVVS